MEGGFKKFGRTLNNKGGFETWKEHRRFAFMINIFGLVVNVLIEKRIIPSPHDFGRYLPFIVPKENAFEGCNILLQLWIVEHLYRPPLMARFIRIAITLQVMPKGGEIHGPGSMHIEHFRR
ncbi:hypothetical protein H5410_003896 [Solanum commersonii]|uniref:Uncharacterized protein n=1 Tax=Solanum commersonii TaxID=4109 RepID=A0A9J6B6E0_SOLCO|nr:hypothetical protein H5410_003896 [Solanum commersonii]